MIRKIVDAWREFAHSEWHHYQAIAPVELHDGRSVAGFVMRRWDGRWIYRECTKEEMVDAQWHWAIK